MKHITTLLLLLFISILAVAQSLNLGGPAQKHFYQQIPYTSIKGKIIIEVEIGGQKHKFLFDTGAPDMVSTQLATQLNIRATIQGNIADAVGNLAGTQIGPVKSLKIGDIEFNDTPTILAIPALFKCLGVDGNIGSNLLRNAIVQINSKNSTITLTDDIAKLTTKPANAIPLNLKLSQQSSPYFDVYLSKGVKGTFLFDTGDNGFLAMDNHYMGFFKKYNAFQTLAAGYGGNSFNNNGVESSNVKYRLEFPLLTIGSASFTSTITETVLNSQSTGNHIGAKLLNYAIVTIDYLHSKFYADPFTMQTDMAEKSWPLAPSIADGKIIIGLVWDKFKDTVKPGTLILAIDGVSTEGIDMCYLVTQKSLLSDKEKAVLTLKDDKGVISKLEIVKE